MGFVDLLKERAKKSIKTIVLPETEDMRTIEATDKILKEGVAKIISSVTKKKSIRKLQKADSISPEQPSLILRHLTELRHTLINL